ncbi:MAG: hypothetical protein JWN86_2777 [Planctomycetota bacterium]|nr:hypothetical protein [Planctomycetota bacterium]
MRSPGRTPRRGYTLVEMLAVMATLTLILGLCVALMELLLKLNTSGKDHVETEARLSRSARIFRDDVHEAGEIKRCEPGTSSTTIELVRPDHDRVVEYQWIKNDLVRNEWSAGEIVKRERFPLPAQASAHFEHRSDGGRSVAAYVVHRRGKQASGPAVDHAFRIEAMVGAAFRFDVPEGAGK